MECFFVLVVVVIVAMFVAMSAHTRQNTLNDAYSQVAHRYGGSSVPAGWFGTPSASFTVNGITVRVDVFSSGTRGKASYTQVHLSWPDPTLRLEVYPVRLWDRMGRFMGTRDIQIGSPQFDEDYVIRGSNETDVRAFLSGAVQYQINFMRRYLGNDDIYLLLAGGKLLIKKLSLIRDADMLRGLVQMALELHAQAMLTQTAGIEFDEDDSNAQPIESPVCQVCGEEIDSDMVVCRRCKTPHHRDCWHYFGRCSTYGCGETRAYTPKPGRPLRAG